ncbi:AAA family ATPase [Burkholderia sp. AU38729]|uniref:AAA family ATPase n=1 Tax=Burkholderia sp. AU38729 TaxID=2879633 RepID=UPI001CF1424E|nr:AAA family ATPase [Burkholderia sp. AU38729]MCA8067364.1 AAA family ATPase [Burkholderia sp. AU38729]
MQLQRLCLPHFRNLRGLDVSFASHLPPAEGSALDTPPRPIRSYAMIGQNGTGKSNLIEALITIFRDIDLDRPQAPFDYELAYSVRGHQVRIVADSTRQKLPFVWVNGKSESQGFLVKHAREYLPSHVFAYYSGKNERMEALFRTHQDRYKQLLRQDGDDLVRRLFYCRSGHSQLVLLACLLSDDPMFKKLLGKLNIEAIESALFVLKKPYAARDLDEQDIAEGDPRFWYQRGTVVNDFLDKLWQVAWAPVQETRQVVTDFRRRPEKQELLYLFVPDQARLKDLGEKIGTPERFFRYAEAAYIGDLLEEVRITVKKRTGHGGDVEFKQLSEGELQMLTVLGLMRVTREDHCLFLLDEPDTHLNPLWKLRYFDDIESVLQPGDGALQGESQIVITTHDPMMVGSLRREQVHILRREGEKSVVDVPHEHPQGMGVAGLLKSELFGLPSTLDQQTLDDLQRRNELLARQNNERLTPAEEEELERLRHYLEELGFSREYRDPMYKLFVQKMYEAKSQPINKLLTPEELAEQEALASAIIKELVAKERKGELAELAKLLKHGGE